MQIDFSEFHPLDHPLHRCVGYPGGWRRHLTYRWEFQWRNDVTTWARHRVGRHTWVALAYRERTFPTSAPPRPGDGTGWTYLVRCDCGEVPDPATRRHVIAEQWKVEE